MLGSLDCRAGWLRLVNHWNFTSPRHFLLTLWIRLVGAPAGPALEASSWSRNDPQRPSLSVHTRAWALWLAAGTSREKRPLLRHRFETCRGALWYDGAPWSLTGLVPRATLPRKDELWGKHSRKITEALCHYRYIVSIFQMSQPHKCVHLFQFQPVSDESWSRLLDLSWLLSSGSMTIRDARSKGLCLGWKEN